MPLKESNLCSATEVQHRLTVEGIRVLDCSWYLPSQNIDARKAHQKQRIPGAGFFDIDKVCDLQCHLPHMLPSAEQFALHVSNLGISNLHDVIVYDSAGLFSAARVWWMFNVFGHSNVKVLDGGLPAWIKAGGELETAVSDTASAKEELPPPTFAPNLRPELVITKAEVMANCDSQFATVLDARSEQRFKGLAPEPRAGLPSGHLPHAVSLPFDLLLQDGQMKPVHQLRQIFRDRGISETTSVVTSCGSGVTASIITLALAECGFGLQRLYDGSWAEWGSAADTEVVDRGALPA